MNRSRWRIASTVMRSASARRSCASGSGRIVARWLKTCLPFSRLIAIIFKGEDEKAVAAYASAFAQELQVYKHDRVRITAPAPAPIEKIRNQYRYLMTIRGRGLKTIREAVRILALHRTPPPGISVAVDVDAQDLL